VKYVGPDLSNPANYKRAVEEYNRRKQDAQRRGLIDDGNLHPDNFLRMQQRSEAPMGDPRAFMEQVITELIAGSPSFDIGGERGDARRSRKGLSPTGVQRLIEANPDFADDIRQMYLPGPALPGVRKAELTGGDTIAQGNIPVGEDPRLPMSKEAYQQLMREKMQRPALGAPQAPYGNPLLDYLMRQA
jgi:hypothetical protein